MLEDMDRHSPFVLPFIGPVVTGIAVGFVAFLWLVVVSSPLLTFSLAAMGAVAWCRWLERHSA
jgi:hypothetical protein